MVSLDTIVIGGVTLALLAGAMLVIFTTIAPRLVASYWFCSGAFSAVLAPLFLTTSSTAAALLGYHSFALALLVSGALSFTPCLGALFWMTYRILKDEAEHKE